MQVLVIPERKRKTQLDHLGTTCGTHTRNSNTSWTRLNFRSPEQRTKQSQSERSLEAEHEQCPHVSYHTRRTNLHNLRKVSQKNRVVAMYGKTVLVGYPSPHTQNHLQQPRLTKCAGWRPHLPNKEEGTVAVRAKAIACAETGATWTRKDAGPSGTNKTALRSPPSPSTESILRKRPKKIKTTLRTIKQAFECLTLRR